MLEVGGRGSIKNLFKNNLKGVVDEGRNCS